MIELLKIHALVRIARVLEALRHAEALAIEAVTRMDARGAAYRWARGL
jgi:hypothetical protein